MQKATYKKYLLAILLGVYTCNFLDRVALGLVLQDIKIELHLSDTQLGFLGGIAFALFYSVLGLPIARWADRGNRIAIISLTAAVWSIMVALCGTAGSFAQLLLLRIGVGVGEAGCVPPAMSLIAEYFNRTERPRAVALYTLGPPLSFLVGFFIAGWMNQFFGWRMTFMVLGAPGLVLAACAWFTLREPRREKSAAGVNFPLEAARMAGSTKQTMLEVCATLWKSATFRNMLFCISVIYFFGYGILQWQPTFFIRSFGLKTGEIGTWFAVTYGVGGVAGSYIGGELASRYAANNERLQLRSIALAIGSFGFISLFIYLSPNRYVGFALIGLATMALNMSNGPLLATIQTIVPENMRATSIALIYLFANLIGMGLGPLAVGALSDILHPWMGEESLRYALLVSAPGYLWGGWHAWRASKSVTRDVTAAQIVNQRRAALDLAAEARKT